jgi:hypothetical protein
LAEHISGASQITDPGGQEWGKTKRILGKPPNNADSIGVFIVQPYVSLYNIKENGEADKEGIVWGMDHWVIQDSVKLFSLCHPCP